MCNLHKLWQCSQMCVRNNICWRIRGSDLSLLPWSCGLCIFVEQLCLVASRRFSRHLKGRSVCQASLSSASSPLSSSLRVLRFPASPLYIMLGIHGLQTKQANKQNNRKTHHPDKVGLGLGERDGGERSCLLSGPVPFHCDGREGLPGHGYPHFCLTSSGDQGGSQSALTHHLLTQYTAGCIHGPVAFT